VSILLSKRASHRKPCVKQKNILLTYDRNDAPVDIYFGEVYGNASDLFSPEGGVKNLYAASLPIDTIGWALPMITARPNVTVEAVSKERIAGDSCC